MSIRKTGAMLLLMACLFSPLCGAVAQDWGGLKVFAAANAELAQPADGRPLVVLMGDSITEIWPMWAVASAGRCLPRCSYVSARM